MQMRLTRSTLRPWRLDDAQALLRHANDKEIAQNLRDAFPHPYTAKDAAEWLGRATNQEPVRSFAIEVGGEAAGGIGIFPLDDVYRRSGEIGYWLARAHWNKGIVTEAAQAMTEYAFGPLDLVRVQTGIFEWNPASMRVLEKCGYVREGLQKRAVFKDGRFGDCVLYAKLRD